MATEVNQNYFAWTQEEPSVQDSSQGTPQVFDHGSISFGRFELESLAWEKWSVFTNDRRHEEFGKFNGLVAKKKAYFEEYFKRIRELKALQQQNQQTELNLEYSGDGSDSSQTGEDEPAAEHGSPAGSGVHLHSMEQAEAQTIFEHDLEYYDDHENERLINDISSSVGGMHQIGQEIREDASCDNFSGKMDVLQQSTNSGQDGPVMLLQSMMTPKRTIEKDSPIDQATKIIPKNAKMTSSNIPDHAGFNKGPDSGKPHAMNHKFKQENIQSTRRLQPAAGFIGTTGRTRLVANPAPSIIGVRRPSSPAPQRPSTRERRPVTRDSSRKPLGVATPCRPSTAERRPATKELAPKQGNIALPRRPSTPDRRPMTKELAPMHANTGTPRRPSTAERRPINRQMAPMQVSIATPRRPSTAERRPVARETARKHADVISLRRPSTAERRPITTETVRKHADVITLCQPSTSERRSVSREIAPKLAHVTPPRRPSTSERRPATRETALNHYNVPSSCRPSTPERHTRGSALLHANIVRTPQRPSTGERRPISTESICKLDAKAPIRSRATPANPKGAISTKVITKKAPTPKLIRSSKAEIKSCANERMKRQVDGKQKSSSVNLPPGKMLTPIIRANQVLESFRKPNKESIKETMQSRVSASKTVTPLQTGSMMARAPNPPPPPPPPRRPSQASNKPNTNNSPPPPPRRPSQASNKPNASNPPPPPRRPSQALNVPTANNLSVGVRKHKASGPHWH